MDINLPDNQKYNGGFEVRSRGGTLFANASELPAGSSVSVTSSDEAIASVEMMPDGLNAWIHSPSVGTAIVTWELFIPDTDGPDGIPEIRINETDNVTVTRTLPGTANRTVGSPIDE